MKLPIQVLYLLMMKVSLHVVRPMKVLKELYILMRRIVTIFMVLPIQCSHPRCA